MNPKAIISSVTAVIITALSSHTVVADTVINYAITDANSSIEDQRTVYVSNGMVRLINSPGSVDPDALYHAQRNEMTLIDHQKQRYIVLSEAKIDSISNQVNNLLDGILGGLDIDAGSLLGNNTDSSAIETKHAGVKKNIAGISCDMYQVTKNGAVISDICVSSPNNINMNPIDYNTLNKMYQTGERMAGKVRNILGDVLGPIPEFTIGNQEGLPIFIQSYDQNNLQISLKGFSEQAINNSIFTIPAGYTETDITSLMP